MSQAPLKKGLLVSSEPFPSREEAEDSLTGLMVHAETAGIVAAWICKENRVNSLATNVEGLDKRNSSDLPAGQMIVHLPKSATCHLDQSESERAKPELKSAGALLDGCEHKGLPCAV